MAADLHTTVLRTRADIDARFEDLLARVKAYREEADVELLRRAYAFAYDVHDGQLRQSGEPYIMHPVEACHILADIEADEWSLSACLLHDTVEDCAQDEEREVTRLRRELDELASPRTKKAHELSAQIQALEHVVERLKEEVGQQLAEEFGPTIAGLVDGVTRLSEVRFYELSGARPDPAGAGVEGDRAEQIRRRLQAENMRRMVVAAAKDVRVLIIKLADRLHNMQTLYAKRRPKQIKIARETEVIYAKLADRLGIWRIKWEMEDLAFRYLRPEAYFDVERRVHKTREERMADIDAAVAQINAALEAEGVPASVYGRPKHLASIYHKVVHRGVDFDDIYDLEAVRIITDTVQNCYKCLYIVHSMWQHQPKFFHDNISNPKTNGYQSIHTKVIVPSQGPMEIQIRTAEMHRQAEYGVAAHWRYKEDGVIDETFAHKLTMLRRLFEMAKDTKPAAPPGADDSEDVEDDDDFLQEVESSLWEEEVFVFTPKGEVIDLPKGATVVDFAYRIHSEVGHTTIGARVNKRMVPLDYQLRSGDQVEILRQKNTGPSRDWLKFVRTAGARNRIRQYYRRKERDSLVDRGQQRLEEEAAHQRVDLNALYRRDRELPQPYRRRGPDQPVEDLLTRVARRRNYNTDDDLLTAVGDGVVSPEGVVRQMAADVEEASAKAGLTPAPNVPLEDDEAPEPRSDAAVTLQGVENMMFRRSKCCLPIPGDPIYGYITRGTGIAIHRADCANVRHLKEKEPDRIVELNWDQTEHMLYDVPLEIRANDRIGLLRDLTQLMSDVGVNILKINTISPRLHRAGTDHLATIRLSLELIDRNQLEQLLRRLPAIGVVKVTIRGQVFHDAEKGTRGRAARRSTGSRSKLPRHDDDDA